MEWLDPVVLARLQFAFTVTFHFLFPAFTIGLASYLAVLEGLWLWTRDCGLPRALPVLAADLRRRLRHGRRLRHRHVLPVRHQLEPAQRHRRRRHGPGPVLRGADRLLPRGGLPRHHAVRLEAGRREGALLRHLHGGAGHRLSRPSGSCRPTAGCTRRPATPSSTAASSPPTGGRSSSTPPSPTASSTPCSAPT